MQQFKNNSGSYVVYSGIVASPLLVKPLKLKPMGEAVYAKSRKGDYGNSVLYAQFCYEPKTALKKKKLRLFNKTKTSQDFLQYISMWISTLLNLSNKKTTYFGCKIIY